MLEGLEKSEEFKGVEGLLLLKRLKMLKVIQPTLKSSFSL